MLKTPKPLFWLSVLLASLFLLAACGSDDDTATVVEIDSENVLDAKRNEPLRPNEGFHNDAAVLVGNTGSPQLIEFFTEW